MILSDIHGNIDALQAVLADAAGEYDEIHCLGDLVGYGAAPGEVIAWVRDNTASCVRGNHDRACNSMDDLEFFNPIARASVMWTHRTLDENDRAWLASLPKGPLQFDDFELAHGSPADEDEYVINVHDAAAVEMSICRPLCFIGHTHLQCGWVWQRGGMRLLRVPALDARQAIHDLSRDSLYLINPGSVGQPRDRNPRAAYALWDDTNRVLAFRRAEYDVSAAQQRIVSAGLDPWLAERLQRGI